MALCGQRLTKEEIADCLGVPVEQIWRWTRQFADWLSVDAHCGKKRHDHFDLDIYRMVQRIDSNLGTSIEPPERAELVRQALWSSSQASSVRMAHQLERKRPDIERWGLLDSDGICLRQDFAWLRPLGPSITSVLVCGCWASSNETCSEPYALLWTLGAERVVVLDKNASYLRNAQDWLQRRRKCRPYFDQYHLEFLGGDMERGMGGLEGDTFDLAYCADVLYNMQHDLAAVSSAISQMARVVRPRGCVVAIEKKFGAESEEVEVEFVRATFTVPRQATDMSYLFEGAGLRRVQLADAPPYSYCYRK